MEYLYQSPHVSQGLILKWRLLKARCCFHILYVVTPLTYSQQPHEVTPITIFILPENTEVTCLKAHGKK